MKHARSTDDDEATGCGKSGAPAFCEVAPHRGPDDDFVCLRYRVWYASFDCAIRTHFRTASGCLNCDQGRFNLKRHYAGVVRLRGPFRRLETRPETSHVVE